MELIVPFALLALGGSVSAPPASALQGLTDYGLATCLTQAATGPLRDEGYSLGSIAISDLGRSPLDFDPVRKAVQRELQQRPMTTVHIDAPVDRSDKPAGLAHCLHVVRTPAVRAAIGRLNPAPASR